MFIISSITYKSVIVQTSFCREETGPESILIDPRSQSDINQSCDSILPLQSPSPAFSKCGPRPIESPKGILCKQIQGPISGLPNNYIRRWADESSLKLVASFQISSHKKSCFALLRLPWQSTMDQVALETEMDFSTVPEARGLKPR